MKIGDIVIVEKKVRGIIEDIGLIHFLVKYDTGWSEWWTEEHLEPVNCSIGTVWDRYVPRSLYQNHHDIVDRYTGKVIDSYRD